MIQRHKITLNITSQDSEINSKLQIVNNYQVNNINFVGQGIVNPSNVRGFLSNVSNQIIVDDFFSYLSGTTNPLEFSEIFNSDEKLSKVFNNYYNSSVVLNQTPPYSVIEQSLSGTSGFTFVSNEIFNYNGTSPYRGLQNIPLSINNSTRILNVSPTLTTFTEEESYYIPVFIKRNYSLTERESDYMDEILNIIENFTPNIQTPPITNVRIPPIINIVTPPDTYDY